jgi:hypothetical protein
MVIRIGYKYFRGSDRDRTRIEEAVTRALQDAHSAADWQVMIDEYLSAPVYSFDISGPSVCLSEIVSKGDDISSELTRRLCPAGSAYVG